MENINGRENNDCSVKPEIEGDRWTWYYVCSECHGQVDWHDEKCKHCGRRLDWT